MATRMCKVHPFLRWGFILLGIVLLFGCSDSDDDDGILISDYSSGVFNTPVGASEPGPAGPGQAYQFSFEAPPGTRLSFATMLVQSNDLFFAPDTEGIELFNGSQPIDGEITDQIAFWDAGTEVNEEPGAGANQAPRQTGPNMGPDENGRVLRMQDVNDGYTYPAVSEMIQVTIDSSIILGGAEFTVTIDNISDGSALTGPLAPGVYVVHTSSGPIFDEGQPDRGEGLEALAEDGDPAPLAAALSETNPSEATFTVTMENRTDMLTASQGGVFDTAVGGAMPGPILPGEAVAFSFNSKNPDDMLSFTTMYGRSNDHFYAPAMGGISLYDGDGMPRGRSGAMDVTSEIGLWDSGTEVNEKPGFGSWQPNFTGALPGHPNVGPADPNNMVRRRAEDAANPYQYGDTQKALRVFLTSDGGDQFTARIENHSNEFGFSESGVFNTPVGAAGPGPAGPGGAYEFSFSAAPGDKLSFATMLVQSNDLFFGPSDQGMPLFDGANQPMSGDITGEMILWDAGTEVNEEPGTGPNQAPRQAGPNTGPDENGIVQPVNDAFTYPPVENMILVTITPAAIDRVTAESGGYDFTVRIENVSGTSDLASPLAPGVFGVHTMDYPFFQSGNFDRVNGLEAVAEDGDPSTLFSSVNSETGLPTGISPGVWLVHTHPYPFFTPDAPDSGQGLEAQAEWGSPNALWSSFAGRIGVPSPLTPPVVVLHTDRYPIFQAGTPDRAEGLEALAEYGATDMLVSSLTGRESIPLVFALDGPIPPGESATFDFVGMRGDRLSFATMYAASNDLFYAPDGSGIHLFVDGSPREGEVTDQVMLWDAGTEENQAPGFGSNQPAATGPADEGPVDPNNMVRPVDDGYLYPDVSEALRVTVSSE